MKNAVDMLEEAVHLLRACSSADLLPYALGSTPFLVGAVWFVCDRSQPVEPTVPLGAASLIVALLFIWMQCCHAVFARGLRRRLTGEATQPKSHAWIAVQAAVQPTRLVVLPIALLVTVPFAWILAFYENLLAAPRDAELRDAWSKAMRVSRYAHVQNWIALGLLFISGLLIFVNVVLMVYLLPQLLRIFTGIETAFSQAGVHAIANWTFVSVALAVTWFILEPLVKAFYAIHNFYGSSIATGADLSAALKRAAATVVLIAIGAMSLGAQQVDPADLNHSIDQALKNPAYQWKLGDGHQPGFFEQMLLNLQRGIAWLGDRLGEFIDWLFPSKGGLRIDNSPIPKPSSGLAIAAYILTAVAALAILYLLWKRGRTLAAVPTAVTVVPLSQDLEDPGLSAADLPEDEWIRLAREKAAAGDLRLALRALYLGSLSSLGRRGTLSIARGKSNLDYLRELRRRARRDDATIQAFERNLAVFEQSWYGVHAVTPEVFGEFESGFRRIRGHEA